jgi:biotin carboxylase
MPTTILAMTSFEKGFDFLRECKAQGARTLLLTVESLRGAPWPRESIDELFFMPSLYEREHMLNAVSYLARAERIARIVPLDELNLEVAAELREHLRLPGMTISEMRHFRDKLAMRVTAQAAGIRVPPFTRLFPYEDVNAFLAAVPAPWVLKPRTEASAVGIRKISEPEVLWRTLNELGDLQSHYLVEQFVAGDVYHADSIVAEGKVVFCEVHRYHKPPFEVYHGGGLFRTSTVKRGSKEQRELRRITQKVARALGMDRGILHTEYIRGNADGEFYFLETAGRVGGANIAELVEVATGVSLWREAARLEVSAARDEEYRVEPKHEEYGGVIMSLAKQEWPDTSAYVDAEIAQRIHKQHHAGFVLASSDHDRINALLEEYGHRFYQDFHAALPPQTSLR